MKFLENKMPMSVVYLPVIIIFLLFCSSNASLATTLDVEEELIRKKRSYAPLIDKYLNSEFYVPIENGEFTKPAILFFDQIDFGGARRSNTALYLQDTKHVSLSEYLDAGQFLAEEYAKRGEFDNAKKVIERLDDNEIIDRILGWNKADIGQNAQVKKHDRTFEFLSVMVGGDLGQDERITWIISLAEHAQKLTEEGGSIEKAKEILSQAQVTASELLPVSLSASTAFLVLTDAQAHFGDYDTAQRNLKKVINACCKQHPNERRLIQNKNHHDLAYKALISGSLSRGDLKSAELELLNIQNLANRYSISMDIAEAYIKSGDVKKAQEYLDTVEASVIKTNYWDFFYESEFQYPEEKAHFLNLLSMRYHQNGEVAKAKDLLDKAVDIYFPKHKSVMMGASFSHGRKPQFHPFSDILKSYVLQGRVHEVESAFEVADGYNLPSRTRPILYDLAVWSAENDDLENFYKILEVIKYGDSNISFLAKAAIDENKKEYVKRGRYKKAISLQIQYEKRNLHLKHAKGLLRISALFAEKEDLERSKAFFDLYKKSIEQHYKISFQEYIKRWSYGEQASVVGQVHILEALFRGDKKLDEEIFQDVMLTVRGSRGSYDGYSFGRKSSLLLELSRLFHKFGFSNEASRTIELSELMAYRINSLATRYRTPENKHGISSMYAKIAKEYIFREEFADADRLFKLMRSGYSQPRFNGAERSVDIIRQRVRANVALEAIHKNKKNVVNELASKVTHPLLTAVISSKAANAKFDINFHDTVKDLWSPEEIIFLMPYYLEIADISDDKEESKRMVAYAQKIGDLIFYSSRGAEDVIKSSLLLGNYYVDNGQLNIGLEIIKRARNYLSQVYNNERKEKYTTVLNKISSKASLSTE